MKKSLLLKSFIYSLPIAFYFLNTHRILDYRRILFFLITLLLPLLLTTLSISNFRSIYKKLSYSTPINISILGILLSHIIFIILFPFFMSVDSNQSILDTIVISLPVTVANTLIFLLYSIYPITIALITIFLIKRKPKNKNQNDILDENLI